MYLFLNGSMALALLFILTAYSIWKHDKKAIKASVIVGLLLLLIHYLGASWNVAPIILGFLCAILVLCKIVYDV